MGILLRLRLLLLLRLIPLLLPLLLLLLLLGLRHLLLHHLLEILVLRPNCPSGSVNDQAKRPENQNLQKMMKKEVPKPQRKKKRNKSFIMHTASSSYKTRRKKF